MRTALLALVVLCSCGRDELPAPVVTNRVRLESNFQHSEGFRFSDRTRLTIRTVDGGRCAVDEVRKIDGTLVTGEAARTDLQADTGRFLTLLVPGGTGCVVSGLVSSVAEIDASGWRDWSPTALLQLSLQEGPDLVGTGLVVHTARGEVYRLRIVQTGFDAVGRVDFVTFDFEALPASCSAEGGACVVRDDCCNGRHSCSSGTCQY